MHSRSTRPFQAALLALCAALPLAAQSTLTTTFTSNNGGNVGGAVHFDLTVLNPAGVVIDRLDVNCANPASTPAWIDVYMTNVGGTHVGNTVSPAPGTWSLRATSSVTTAGNDNPTIAMLNKPVALLPGTYGVTLVHRGCAARYTGTAAAPPTQTTFANNDLRLDLGTAQNVPFSSGAFSPRVANVTMHYSVLAGTVADFTADVTRGASPLFVTFTDRSVAPGGAISAWAWDFDDDGVVDSTQQNPPTVYATCGDRSVRLTITTSTGTATVLWQDLIEVDPLTADFTMTPEVGPPPLAVNFADTSSLQATSWAWDFDGDGVAESTQQNPQWAFGPGRHEVTLTVTNGCRTEQVKKSVTAATDSLTTPFNANSFINRTSMIFFDLQVNATEALSICGFDFNSFTPAGNPMAVDVWISDASSLGNETNAAAWRRVASAVGTTPGGNVPARLPLDRPILLLPGRSYGVGIEHIGNASYYVNQSAPIANADLTLTPVAAAYIPNGPFSATPAFAPRQWVGTIHYLKQTQWPQAAVTFFARGCAGSLGVPGLEPVGASRPLLGTTLSLQASRLPIDVGILMLGLSNTSSPFGPLPLPLGGIGMPNCSGLVSPDARAFLFGSGGSALFNLALPANASLAGTLFYTQVLALDPATNAFGAVLSDATGAQTGVF